MAVREWVNKHQSFTFFLALSIFFRLINFQNFLYFTWDQGRDAFALRSIMDGDLTLIGPTSGLPGFFLGPLWYYLGIPGFILFQGNPYGISIWYILISCLALPLFWHISHQLFADKRHALVASYLLSFMPGSISGSVMIWNPLLAIPLISASYVCLWKAQVGRIWLWLGFFLLALTLQAEFAYAIFFLIPLFFLIPWLRGKFSFTDFLGSALAVGITLVPQLLFELRNNWIMANSLFAALQDPTRTAPWHILITKRPLELFWTTATLFGGISTTPLLPFICSLLSLTLFGLYKIWLRRKNKDLQSRGWQLLALMTVIPYPFFSIWRGNYGNFFEYYLTPHFIFLAPLLLLGVLEFKKITLPQPLRIFSNRDWMLLIFGGIVFTNGLHLAQRMFPSENRAGLKSMETAVDQIYKWAEGDGYTQPVVKIFTPNIQTEHYDYLFHWKSRSEGKEVPVPDWSGQDQWYILIEPDKEDPKVRFLPWYENATKGGALWRKEQVGNMTLETWGSAPKSGTH